MPLMICHISAAPQSSTLTPRWPARSPPRQSAQLRSHTASDSSKKTQKQINGPHQRLAWYNR